MAMCNFCDFFQIGADTVISRIVDQDGFCIRVFDGGTFDIFCPHAERNAEIFVFVRIYINRNGTVYNQCIDGTAVYISWHNKFVTGFAD